MALAGVAFFAAVAFFAVVLAAAAFLAVGLGLRFGLAVHAGDVRVAGEWVCDFIRGSGGTLSGAGAAQAGVVTPGFRIGIAAGTRPGQQQPVAHGTAIKPEPQVARWGGMCAKFSNLKSAVATERTFRDVGSAVAIRRKADVVRTGRNRRD